MDKLTIILIIAGLLTAGGIGAGIYYNGRSNGVEAQVTKQRKVDDAAQKRIKDVPPADADSTSARLLAGTF